MKHKNGSEKVVKKNGTFIFGETNKKWVKYKKCGNSVIQGRCTSKKQRKITEDGLQKMKKQYRHGKVDITKESCNP